VKTTRSTFSRLARGTGAALALVCLATTANAERAWVKEELRLNVRSGPGLKYRILGPLVTGDGVEILSRTEDWTQVRPDGMESGWIPSGYLQSTPPARIALARVEAENAELKERLAKLSSSEAELRSSNEEISERDASQQAEITRLTRENIELRAGARWPEWITGGGIVLVGMMLGAIVARSSGRRRQQRIKL
jgi:SH3 domain protein